jgi:hypothetical protein
VELKIKPGASDAKMVDRMREACTQIEDVYTHFGCDLWLTSGDEVDTVHKGRPVAGDTVNAHYLGKAADFRIWNVPQARRQLLVDMIEDTLGPDFYVEWEAHGTDREHLHVQLGHVVP